MFYRIYVSIDGATGAVSPPLVIEVPPRDPVGPILTDLAADVAWVREHHPTEVVLFEIACVDSSDCFVSSVRAGMAISDALAAFAAALGASASCGVCGDEPRPASRH